MNAPLSKRRFKIIVKEVFATPAREIEQDDRGVLVASELLKLSAVYADYGAFLTARARAIEGIKVAVQEVALLDQIIDQRRRAGMLAP